MLQWTSYCNGRSKQLAGKWIRERYPEDVEPNSSTSKRRKGLPPRSDDDVSMTEDEPRPNSLRKKRSTSEEPELKAATFIIEDKNDESSFSI